MKLGKAKIFHETNSNVNSSIPVLFKCLVVKKKVKGKGTIGKTKKNSFKNSHMQICCYDLLPPTLHSRLSTGLKDWG